MNTAGKTYDLFRESDNLLAIVDRLFFGFGTLLLCLISVLLIPGPVYGVFFTLGNPDPAWVNEKMNWIVTRRELWYFAPMLIGLIAITTATALGLTSSSWPGRVDWYQKNGWRYGIIFALATLVLMLHDEFILSIRQFRLLVTMLPALLLADLVYWWQRAFLAGTRPEQPVAPWRWRGFLASLWLTRAVTYPILLLIPIASLQLFISVFCVQLDYVVECKLVLLPLTLLFVLLSGIVIDITGQHSLERHWQYYQRRGFIRATLVRVGVFYRTLLLSPLALVTGVVSGVLLIIQFLFETMFLATSLAHRRGFWLLVAAGGAGLATTFCGDCFDPINGRANWLRAIGLGVCTATLTVTFGELVSYVLKVARPNSTSPDWLATTLAEVKQVISECLLNAHQALWDTTYQTIGWRRT